MPYREKSAWLYLIAMTVTYGPYFTLVSIGFLPSRPLPDLRQLALFGATTIIQLIILGAGHLILMSASSKEDRTPPDERDLAITRRSTTSAYNLLLGGMILVGVIMPFTSGGWAIVHAALFMIIAAEILRYTVMVFSYRRQA
jgi:hypothetical protein